MDSAHPRSEPKHKPESQQGDKDKENVIPTDPEAPALSVAAVTPDPLLVKLAERFTSNDVTNQDALCGDFAAVLKILLANEQPLRVVSMLNSLTMQLPAGIANLVRQFKTVSSYFSFWLVGGAAAYSTQDFSGGGGCSPAKTTENMGRWVTAPLIYRKKFPGPKA